MQDRFKFRYVLNNKIYEVVNIYFNPVSIDLQITEDECLHLSTNEVDFANLIQCTGLKDKNGKLIYEGDILGGIYENLYIHWCDKCKQFQLKTNDYGCMACEGDIHWYEIVENNNNFLEVIGNVYENKELLND